ncbi:terpene synthase family protein [Streptomyces sp. NPDC054975]
MGEQTVHELTIPDLPRPFTSEANPQGKGTDEETGAWMEKFGLVERPHERAEHDRYGTLCALTYPFGESRESLQLASDGRAWAASFHDRHIKEPALAGHLGWVSRSLMALSRVVDDPHGAREEDDPHHRAWRDWWLRLEQVATPGQFARTAAGWAYWSRGLACEAVCLSKGRLPCLPDFLMIRRAKTAFRLFITFPELISGKALPEKVWAHPQVLRLQDLAADAAGYYQDITLFDPEVDTSTAMTLPNVLANHYKCSLQEGLFQAADVYRSTLEEFTRLGRSLREIGDPQITTCVQDTEAVIAGFIHWHQLTARYGVAHV